MEPFAFALPTAICYVVGSFTQVEITMTISGGDGGGNPIETGILFIWDAAVPVSDNLSILKTAIVNQIATQFNTVVLSTNVNVLMGIN